MSSPKSSKSAKAANPAASRQVPQIIFFALLLLAGFYAYAQENESPTGSTAKPAAIGIEQAWSRATPKGTDVGAGFMLISNKGAIADRLIAASSPLAGHIELHEMKMINGVMRMRWVRNLVIPANSTMELKPGGAHIMFMDLKAPIVEGRPFKAILRFEKAGLVEVEFDVKPTGAPGAGH